MPGSVTADRLSFTYRDGEEKALDGITVELESGQTAVLMGRGGAGKSTFCFSLNGLVPHFYRGDYQGRVSVYGVDVVQHRVYDNSRLVGMVFQDFESQLFSSTVELEVAFAPENHRLPRDEIRRRVDRYLDVTGLSDLIHRQPFSLSGGQKQRLAIASVLAMEPRLLVMDEPTTDLDPQGREEVLGVAGALAQEERTLLLVDHEVETALMGQRVLVMKEGRLVLDGPPQEVLTHLDELTDAGVRPPAVAELFRELDLSPLPITVEQARSVLEGQALRAASAPQPAPSTGTPLLEPQQVSYRYEEADVTALSDINLTIGAGEFVALLGANGSGKTTLAKLLNGLLRPTRGRVLVDGNPLEGLPRAELARRVGYVFQNPDHQIFAATVRDEVAFGPKNFGVTELEERVAEALEATHLEGYEERDPFALTKGERQRVAVASVLATRPEVLILDEPTTGLDWPQQRAMMNLLEALHRQGHTIIVITHSMRLAAEHADRVIVLERGRILADGPPREIFFRPQVLRQAGLQAPQIVRLAEALGVHAVTVEELAGLLREGTREAPG